MAEVRRDEEIREDALSREDVLCADDDVARDDELWRDDADCPDDGVGDTVVNIVTVTITMPEADELCKDEEVG